MALGAIRRGGDAAAEVAPAKTLRKVKDEGLTEVAGNDMKIS